VRAAWIVLGVLVLARGASADDDVRGWVGLGGRNALGPAYSDFGVYAMSGLWLAHEHLQPFVRLGWSQGGGGGFSIDALRAGIGLAAGAPLAREHVWIGGSAAVEGMYVWSQDGTTSAPLGMLSLSALVQVRAFRRFLVGVEAGPDFFPSLLRSARGNLLWDAVRFNAGLRLGVILGPTIE
jgi:hypothetical protein